MTNEKDELVPQNHESKSDTSRQTAGTKDADTGLPEKSTEDDGADDDAQKQALEHSAHKTVDQMAMEATGAKGKLNDLVADLYISALSNGPVGVGQVTAAASSATYAGFGDYKNIRATAGPGSFSCDTAAQAPPPTQNTFSFKHFLSSGASSLQAPSSTVTSLDMPAATCNAASIPTTTTTSTFAIQSSTGARPKVPQSCSSTLMSSLSVTGSAANDAAGTKMKRSPRFSSFDSQASLAGAAAAGNEEDETTTASGASFSGGFRLHPETERVDIFSAQRVQTANTSSSDYERQFVPRSYSHYDMQLPAGAAASPRRRMETIEARPNRLSLAPSSKQRVRLEAHCFPGELPPDVPANRSNTSDFPAAAAAAALPDFVQDHWLDSWYASEMHLNSPPNSPVCDFVQDLPGGGGVASTSSAAANAVPAALDVTNPPVDTDAEPPTQRLPDFLSDGPIIHSSQRLADVAAGLPSNLINSPEDAAMKLQIGGLRLENERQRRELTEARKALAEQTRRSNELERQLMESQRSDASFSRSKVAQNMAQAEEDLEQSKRRQAVAQAHVRKLKQQVKQLLSELDCLRRENETLREEGAVGGCSSSANCDRSSKSGVGAASAASSVRGAGAAQGNTIRPSRSQQISRDLLRAASNAENNLKQLLAGVDNLRQMAADIEQSSDLRQEYDVSPDLFSDFLDECDDYEEYPGGPAL